MLAVNLEPDPQVYVEFLATLGFVAVAAAAWIGWLIWGLWTTRPDGGRAKPPPAV